MNDLQKADRHKKIRFVSEIKGGHGMKNKKVLAIVMAVMTVASALVGCGATEATAPADTAVTTEKRMMPQRKQLRRRTANR